MTKIKLMLLIVFSIAAIIFVYFFVGFPKTNQNMQFGVDFSQFHSQKMGLNWKDNYIALLDDLKVRDFRILTNWDFIEPGNNVYNFDDLDWQIEQAKERNASISLVIGMKTGRWPECHIPDWAKDLSKPDQQQKILALLTEIVNRYKGNKTIEDWYVENEPLLPFGNCPWHDKKFLESEVALVKSLDPNHKVVVTDSGEASFWLVSAQIGDIVGTTLYRRVWMTQLKSYLTYPIPPIFYQRKADLIKFLYHKKVIGTELQAEPWCPNLLYNCSLEEQQKTMNLDQFKANVEFASKTGFDKFYLWGSEWWYWLKVNQNQPAIWQEAKILFQ